jgi:CBS domain-containing protein
MAQAGHLNHANKEETMKTWITCQTIGGIKPTNSTRIRTGTSGTDAAETLLSSHAPEAPVVDPEDRFLGFVTEMDLVRAFEAGEDLETTPVEDLMSSRSPSVDESTSIESAAHLMDQQGLVNLPVLRDGIMISTVSRHDILRVLMNAGLGVEL